MNGLPWLVRAMPAAVQAAALAWCVANEVCATSLISETDSDEDFIAALPLNPSLLPAKALRKRLAELRDRA